MGSRKRSKPNPQSEFESQAEPPDSKPSTERKASSQDSTPRLTKAQNVTDQPRDSSDGAQQTTSSSSTKWYGSWPRGFKSNPITQVARESISATNDAASTLLASAVAKGTSNPASFPNSPALRRLSRNMKNSTTSLPLITTNTKANITSSSSDLSDGSGTKLPSLVIKPEVSQLPIAKEVEETRVPEKGPQEIPQQDGAAPQPPPTTTGGEDKVTSPENVSGDAPKWVSWFTRPATLVVQDPTLAENNSAKSELTQKNTNDQKNSVSDSKPSPESEEQPQASASDLVSPTVAQAGSRNWSWLGLWNDAATQPKSNVTVIESKLVKESNDNSKPQDPTSTAEQRSKLSPLISSQVVEPLALPKSTGWAFWSQDRPQDGGSGQTADAGELAIAKVPSSSNPDNAVILDAQRLTPKPRKRERPQSLDLPDELNSKDLTKGQSVKGKTSSSVAVGSSIKSTQQPDVQAKKDPVNLVLPSFRHTYKAVGKPSFIQQLSRLLKYTRLPEPKHVSLFQDPPRIKNALAIGVHGYFPAPLIRSVLGQPTGTSIRFANGAASAIHKWTQNQGYRCEVEKIALEGEGKVAERIELLWKLLLNWVEKIRRADFIMIACHSQGVPVAMMLVAKLIEFGCLNNTRIGVCALAGINLGPFTDYKSRWIGGSAGELFDFARLDSQVSKDYEAALGLALKFGVKVVYIGSIDDQLVSLESSTFGTISHPYIYRAVFVDGRIHAPDFLTHLVGFALKLRNRGISDHGLIRELSSSLAGSLYSGEGHSRIYDDDSVYDLAVEFALETTSVGSVPLQSRRQVVPSLQNPYILPFAMRGILEENHVQTELYDESMELLKQFDDWKPASKVLKDVKFRLEGVRSKL